MKRFSLFSTLVYVLLLLSIISCDSNKKVTTEILNLETAKVISHLPAEVIEPTGTIRVRFVEPQIEKDQIATAELNPDVLEIDPAIDGTISWADERTIEFKPDKELNAHDLYTVTINLDEFENNALNDLDPVVINIRVAGQELLSFDGDFNLLESGNPKKVYFNGILKFIMDIDLEKLRQAASFKTAGGQSVAFEINGTADPREVTFKSETLQRDKTEKTYILSLDDELMELPASFSRNITLPSLKDLTITNLQKDETGEQPRMRMDFSDELNAEQDINGFISIEPAIDFTIRKMDKSVFITAPFEYGNSYTFNVKAGIKSKWATTMTADFQEKVDFQDLLPEIKFSRDGVFLPTANQQKIAFMTVNVRRVQLRITRVFESNLGQFLQMENLNGNNDRRDQFNYNINRVGVPVADTSLIIGGQKNRWLQSELDLKKLLNPNAKGLLLLEAYFEKDDMIYEENNDSYSSYRRRGRYDYGKPGTYWYMRNKGHIFKPLILTDIGLTYKKLDNKCLVFATNLLDTEPMGGVNIRLRTYQNQIIKEGQTNASGIAQFPVDESVFYVEAAKGSQRSIIKLNDMLWNVSNFDVDGKQSRQGGLNAFTYTERGVYRPGDTVNVSAIIRNKSGTFPDDHPVTMEIINPRGQKILTRTQNKARDGFYSFRFNTNPTDPTGNYNARFNVGSVTFDHNIKIETVVPERIKIKLEADKEELHADERDLNLNITANYLFGNPAANLETEVDVAIRKVTTSFPKYKGFIFENSYKHFQPIDENISRRSLDGQGQLNIKWRAPDLSKSPGRIRARFDVKVLEKGGRPAQKSLVVPIEPFERYVGLKIPDLRWGYAQIGSEYKLSAILVNTAGQSVPGRTLKYTIYKNESYWWWEYNNHSDFRLRFKEDSKTEKLQEGRLISGTIPASFTFKPELRGEYLIEVADDTKNGHSTSFFLNAYHWGDSPDGQKNAGTLVLNSDKKEYSPGEDAVISFPVPQKGQVLLTIEKGNDVLVSEWHPVPAAQKEMRITVPITEKMLPTAYVSISLIQPHAETKNDRPLRTFGILPLNVFDPATRHGIKIDMPDELETGKPFEVQIRAANKKKTQFTIGVVDEGLLQLTNFQTPDPWDYFYSKERLAVLTYDLYGHVIGANKGDIFKTFSIGGGLAEMKMMADKDEDKTAKRFKAVSIFEGPLQTNSDGYAKLRFKMPDYIGAVRVMVVGANNKRYGNAQKVVPVTSDLMVMPTLPRVLGPADQVRVPVTVFAMKENLGETKASVSVDGPVSIIGQKEYKVNFSKPTEEDLFFTLKAKEAIGIAKIKITAKSAKADAEYTTELQVRTSALEEYINKEEQVQPGEKVTVTIPGQGIEGSNKAVVTVRRTKDLNFGERLFRLIRYPYGCLEQTTSSVFPQLYLEKFIPKSTLARQDIKDNINDGIKRINRFRLASGAFSYWPGSGNASQWATNYAGHFLIEAKKLGYYVPDDLMDSWLRYQKSQALLTTGNLMTRVYRLYLLALAGEPAMGPMNLIRESGLAALKDRERWLLAAAYKLAGAEKEAGRILDDTGIIVDLYREFGGTYGSSNRDKAVILDQMVLFGQMSAAESLVDELATVIKSKRWLSTQESAFMLMALGKYLNAAGDNTEGAVVGYIELADGKKIEFDFTTQSFDLEIVDDFAKDITVYLDDDSKVNHAYVVMNWHGVPLRSTQNDEQKNLKMTVRWLNENGQPVDPANLVQGESIWGHFNVGLQNSSLRVEELALTQIIPAGWEIENLRLNNRDLPSWTRGYRMVNAEFEDIRDDRISWFFDMNGYNSRDYLVKINAVSVGDFFMPGATFKAMYDNDYRATKAGKVVKVQAR